MNWTKSQQTGTSRENIMTTARNRDSTTSWMGRFPGFIKSSALHDILRFGIITGKLKEMYQMITLGGDAELELVDSLDPFSEGIVFSVLKLSCLSFIIVKLF